MLSKKTFVGVDVGGTKIYAARFSESFEIEEEIQILTEGEKGEEHLFQRLLQTIKSLNNQSNIAIGIGWPGPIYRSGKIMRTPNIPGFFHYPLPKKVQKEIGIPVFVENDSRLFTFAEAKKRGKENLIGIILGTGVGGGVIENGKMKRGLTGLVGEFGHIKNKKGEKYDDILSGRGLEKSVTTYGETEAIKMWKENLLSLLNKISKKYHPEEIVFGGSVSTHVLKDLLPEIQQETEIKLSITELKNSGALGAAMYAKKCLRGV